MMKVYVCIDDTDNIDSIGTGTVADYIKEAIENTLGFDSSMTTRHQLFIHEDVPYTSHNSSMCFVTEVPEDRGAEAIEAIKFIAAKVIVTHMAEGSDPGLCVTNEFEHDHADVLIRYGKETKSQLKTKEEAYALAASKEIHLSEHGGTGDGIIGALAGVGLRMSGNDGEVKGGLKDLLEGSFEAADLLKRGDVERIYNITSQVSVTSGLVHFPTRSKSVLRDGQFTLFVTEGTQGYVVVSKKEIRQLEIGDGCQKIKGSARHSCKQFVADVAEECLDDTKGCINCMYRRWDAEGIVCIKGHHTKLT